MGQINLEIWLFISIHNWGAHPQWSELNLSVQWKCIAHNLSLCCLLQNWMRTSLMGLERDRCMAMLYEPFGSDQTLWDRTPLNLVITMGLCDRLNVLFSEWCGSLGSDNGFTLHHLFPEALYVTRPLLFTAFWTNCAASTHLQQFWIRDLFVLLSATVKWKWLAFGCNMRSYCLFATQSGIILFQFVSSSCPSSWLKEDYVNSRVTVITSDLFRASLSFSLFFFYVCQCFCSKSYCAHIRILHALHGWLV